MLHSILLLLLLLAFIVFPDDAAAFTAAPLTRYPGRPSLSDVSLQAKKAKKSKPKGGGGGFGAKPATAPSVASISADKHALEAQWDTFASVTDLEIAPPGDPDDEDYEHFIVADVFVRIGPGEDEEGTGWYRTGKAMAAGDAADIRKALTLQKGLIFWTASHMWPQLASKGKAAATRMELGYAPPSMTMADETDGVLDEEEGEDVMVSQRVDVKGVSAKEVGFRPDFNPPGFTYKRRERAAMKKKKSALEEIADAS
ncbi:hypothetical protein ACHAXT_008586 [Thalassiosira profunda]